MFGRKKAASGATRNSSSPQRIRIDGPGGTLYDGALTALSVPEPLIIELSIEFFDDPEPCQIHRGAVLRRVFMELMELGENSTTPAAALPDNARRYLSAYPELTGVTLYRGEDE